VKFCANEIVRKSIILHVLTMSLFTLQVAEQDYEREKLNERIAKLSGGVAVIQVIDSLKCVYISSSVLLKVYQLGKFCTCV